ncbi:keratin-associated protein 16-1-like isoform X2 [Athalia rosae]|uniref:keratin-associated protein 16-1-like isoform X2 n=1 Tax=Athalia rosae TaxID=37344 RepID=UPI00203457D1|nr:keratin-associated protein 16-1-like isoform X2 [Athalia rosae]
MKIIVVSALVITALVSVNTQPIESQKEVICEPGSVSPFKCNTCTCSPDGTAVSCTRKTCPDSTDDDFNADGTPKVQRPSNPLLRTKRGEKEVICEPGSVSPFKCNTCTCSPDGTAVSCTRKTCPDSTDDDFNADGTPKVQRPSNPLLRTKRGEKEVICEPGSVSPFKCNTCTCSPDGTAVSCTRKTCPDSTDDDFNADGTPKVQRPSNPLLRTKRGEKEVICEPGSVSPFKCNTCTCSPDGTAVSCTRKTCPDSTDDDFNADGTPKVQRPSNPLLRTKRGEKEVICEPGSVSPFKCNTCTCSPDGTAVSCTRKTCPDSTDDDFNADGTPKVQRPSNPLLRTKRGVDA